MRRRSVAVGLLVVALVAACSPDSDRRSTSSTSRPGTSSAPSPAPTTTTTAVPVPVPPPVTWRGCDDGLQCGSLVVPVDYSNPGAGTLELALIRRPAGDPAQRIGTLVVNPGGPGASGVRRVRRGFAVSAEVSARFDLVGFDPRGVGDSAPITCGGAAATYRSFDLAPESPVEQVALETGAMLFAGLCDRDASGQLAHYGTLDVARDVESLRLGLGEAQLSFLGLSYGTFIGLLWAEQFPASVRSLVLDGVVDPQETGTGTSVDQLDALDDAFREIAAACAADPACPATPDGGVAAAYDRLAEQIEGGAGASAGVGPTQLTYAAFMATYGTEHWPRLWAALHDGLAGDLSGVAAMAATFTGLVAYAPFAVITCLDSPHPSAVGAWRADAARAARRSPRFGAALANELLPCAYLPSSGLLPHAISAPGTPPILVIGSTGDVATPYEQAVRVARNLDRGELLTVDEPGHVALGASDCVASAVTRYLIDGIVPAGDAGC